MPLSPLSSLSSEPAPAAGSMPVNGANVVQNGKQVPVQSFSLKREEVPDWVATELDITKSNVALLEVTSSSKPLYSSLIQYLAHRAVDHDQVAPSRSERLHSDPFSHERQYPGVLTSRFVPEKSVDYMLSRHVPRPKEDEKIRLMLGMGWGRVQTDPRTHEENGVANGSGEAGGNETVFFHHFRLGKPIEECRKLASFRVLQFYGPSVAALEAVCEDAKVWVRELSDALLKTSSEFFVLYTLKVENGNPNWMCQGNKSSRPPGSVVLKSGTMDAILHDAREFMSKDSKAFYIKHGIPYRRSYLFYGPPGQGKTSTIRVMAGELKLKACFMQFTDPFFGDHTLNEALNTAPKPPLLVCEDVDSIFLEDRTKKEHGGGNTLSFSGFLNAIDGLVSCEGLILVMTTNHPERLDPAMLRCGRVDRRFEFPFPGREEIGTLFKSYYPDSSKEVRKKFVDAVFDRSEKDSRSIATLQQLFLLARKNTAEECVERIDEFFKNFFPDGNRKLDSSLYN